MSVRECALQSKAFSKLKEIYDHREKVSGEWRSRGKKVIGELGCDVPDEYIIAAGMLPIHVYADPEKELKETDKYLEYAFDPVVRSQFEKIVDGTYAKQVDGIAISNSTDVIVRIFLYLRELKRVEPDKDLPPIEFIDWLFTRHCIHQVRNEHTLNLYRDAVEKMAGRKLGEEEIEWAIDICNADRQALREMSELRHGEEVQISGSEALVVIGSAFFMEREEHTRLVKQVTEDAKSWPLLTGIRVFFTGSNQESTELYDMAENAGMVIVGEDHDWGDRFYERDCSKEYTPTRAIVDRYMLREFSSKKAYVSQRVDALNREVEHTKAEAVLFYTNRYEDAASWDYPSQKASLEEKKIGTIHFSKMAWPVSANENLQEKLKEAAVAIKGGALYDC